jgi:L-amino acid N-acyltransferase
MWVKSSIINFSVRELLVHRAREVGFGSIVAAISTDRAAGFEEVGRFQQVGYKFDRYLDLVYLQLRLVDC